MKINESCCLKLIPKWISHSFLSVNNGIQIFLLHKWELCVCVLISFQEKPQNKLEATQPGTESTVLLGGVPHWTHWQRLWCWEGLGAGGEGDNRGWDGWMASLTWWTWVWVNSGSWWWTGRPGVLRFMGSQRVGPDWATELNWTEAKL